MFAIIVLSLMVVIFNNTIDLVDKLFQPVFDTLLFVIFGLIVIPSVWYVSYNWSDK